jgi:hypothetical protein
MAYNNTIQQRFKIANMNTIKYISTLALLVGIMAGCKKEVYDDTSLDQSGEAPSTLNALFEITQDNSGNVAITPTGNNASYYDVAFGDTTNTPARVAAGNKVTHKYAEGVYNVKLTGYGVNGKKTEATKQLTVSFRMPENLDFTITKDINNNYRVQVTATALYETAFKVYFGHIPNEIPVTFNEGDVVNFIYPATGNYNIRVVALSGGAATAELIKPVSIVDPVLLPITFESLTTTYNFIGFDGGVVTVINNPQQGGINTSNRVGRMVKNPGQPWGGAVITLGAPINFSANKIFRMKVFSPRVGAKVLLKVENPSNSSQFFEKEVTTTMANAWEDLVFDFTAINTANVYQNLVLIFELGIMGDGSPNFTFLFDDIRLTNSLPTTLLALPVTFDDNSVNYTLTDFGGAVSTIVNDPVIATNKVARTTKPNGAQTWAGTTIGTGFLTPIPFTASATKMSVRVYSPAAGITVRLKVENSNNNTQSVETDKVTTVANAWETLVFDFANQATGTPAINLSYTYNMASIFFDFGTVGNGKVFYWDDVKFEPAATTLALPIDFESATLAYNFTDFDGGNSTVINNPHVTGINTSGKVARMIKGPGQPWGGSYLTLPAPINFATQQTMRMKVWSPRVGAKVLLKVENLTNGGISFEKEVLTTVANGWEDLSFDYTGINTANTYQKIIIIFELGTVGDGSSNFTFYFDDIRQQ